MSDKKKQDDKHHAPKWGHPVSSLGSQGHHCHYKVFDPRNMYTKHEHRTFKDKKNETKQER